MSWFFKVAIVAGLASSCKPVGSGAALTTPNAGRPQMATTSPSAVPQDASSALVEVLARINRDRQILVNLNAQIDALSQTLQTQPQQTEDARKKLMTQLDQLKRSRDEVETALAMHGSDQVLIETSMNAGRAQTATATRTSGFPKCQGVYYGFLFNCGAFRCAKADDQYQMVCEVTESAKPATLSRDSSTQNLPSSVPPCGQVYYGPPFACGAKTCGKSDAAQQLTCELTGSSLPDSTGTGSNTGPSGFPWCTGSYYGGIFDCTGYRCAKKDAAGQVTCQVSPTDQLVSSASTQTPAAQPRGQSGYPYCPATYYGALFNCSGWSCAKSDPGYVNICQVTSASRPAANVGPSGYPYCPPTYYGSLFNCNGRTCAKSDPNYANICELR